MYDTHKVRKLTISIAAVLLVIGLIITVVYINANKNPYGSSVSIKNYSQLIANLPKYYQDSITASLFNIIKLNTDKSDDEVRKITDAQVRESSATQDEVKEGESYTGSFIVDIESIQQSYKVEYSYASETTEPIESGYPILVRCLAVEDLIYGDFQCKDYLNQDEMDPIVAYLPYNSIDFNIIADSSQGPLVIRANLNIPDIDLSGNTASKRQAVALYKKEVVEWIKSKGINPSDYTIIYNFTDDGEEVYL